MGFTWQWTPVPEDWDIALLKGSLQLYFQNHVISRATIRARGWGGFLYGKACFYHGWKKAMLEK